MFESALPVGACRDANAMVQPDLYRRIHGQLGRLAGVGHACMHALATHVSCML
jgi:hypothetical protein